MLKDNEDRKNVGRAFLETFQKAKQEKRCAISGFSGFNTIISNNDF